MIEFAIHQLFPDFILADKNGYAMAKAIERALQIMCETVQTGVDVLQNIDKMPEWRLDEMAWELGCLYDSNANIETKRRWIKDATPLYAALGTPQAVYNFLEGFFEQVELEENWQYAGEPFHFRVTVSGEWNDANESWMRRAIASAKNVRSVLDDIAVGSGTVITVHGEGNLLARFPYPMTDAQPTGIYPQENFAAKTAEGIFVIATHDAYGNRFPYPLAGTKPQENTIGKTAQSNLVAQAAMDKHVFPYPTTGEEKPSGTYPNESTIGKTAQSNLAAKVTIDKQIFPYPATSEEQPSGTIPNENTLGRTADAETHTQSDGKATAFSYSPCAEANLCGEDF